ncbi:MAG TPA: amino acid adenylation domain-containing protein, partial [Thermoanaerobaculia bacterium]|nr:amino acid adenylation domain-containing protein [Thermoanaerobaculia bacterium]
AYVTGRSLNIDALRAHMTASVPQYMVPAAFVALDALPLTPNGKVDRRALPRPEAEAYARAEYEPPKGESEETLAALWQEVLRVERVGRSDSFFDLGGHSLLATRLISRIRTRLHVDVPLKALFERPSVARFAELLAGTATTDVPPIRPVDRTRLERLPLSHAQERVWFFDQLEPGSAGYNLPSAFTISGELDVSRLEEAFRLIIARHENLRTLFPIQDGQARQLILDRLDFALERIDLRDDQDRERTARVICQADAVMPFDLARGPLLRGKVIRLAEEEHLLLLNMHHIISDGWSMSILIRELGLIMDGRLHVLAPLPIQYADYSAWQRTWLEESGTLQRQLAYWQEKLAGVPEGLELATDYARPAAQSHAGARHAFTIDARLAEQLGSLARQNGGTLYMVLLAAFEALVHRQTGQSDVCVGSAIANRQQGETEGLIGMFVNTLALRSRVEGDEPFVTLLARVKATCLEAYEHQDAPFEKVVDALRLQRNPAVSPLFQLLFILQNAAEAEEDGRFRRYLLETGVSKFDLTATFTETADGLAGTFEYSTALYERETIERLAGHFTALCRAIIETPTAKVRDLDYLGQDEKRRLLVDFNDTRIPYVSDRCLHELFIEQVALHPERTALVCGDERLTYQQLYDRSRELALHLQSLGVGPDARVGLRLERSADFVVALLGVLQAGGAYVPLDPEYPDDRLAYMLEDSGAAIVLTQEMLRIRPQIAGELRQDVRPHHLAYVMYTSGSTGRPKGVMVEHRQLVSYVTAIQNELQIPDGCSFALASTFAADLGNTVLFPALLGGGTLHILGREAMTDADRYADYCREHRIDCMKVTPSHLQALVGDGSEACRVPAHTLVLGGEVLSRGVVDLVRRSNPECRIYNHYGPTECSVGVLCGEVGALDSRRRSIPLGTPLGGSRIYILDAQRRPVPIGVAGELYIGGAQVARGYLHQPELTAERFVADPFQDGRMYRTGDMARWRADGTVEYLGRNDFQVKIRGFRIELGEVEAQLARHPNVKEAVVLAREDEPGEKRLVAYVTGQSLSMDDLRAHMQASVPQYMVPSAFVQLEALPLTPNGKVDRRALPKPEAEAFARAEYEPPQGHIEETLAAIWRELLPVERVGRNDDFFELGGHSLLATRLISRIRTRLSVDVPLKALFERSSIARFAELLGDAARSGVPAIRPVDRSQFERLPLSFAQERLWFFDQLEPGGAVYNMPRAVTIRGELDLDRLDRALNVIIARHESLRTVFPSQDGKAYQLVLDHRDFRLQRVDLSQHASARDKALDICQTEAGRPFDLARGPLFRGHVIRLSEDEHILILCMHHIVSDGWSLGILIKELGSIMEGLAPAPLPIQYVDYSIWQRAWLEEGGLQNRQLAYWRQKLTGVPESLDLVTDHPRPAVQSFAGATQTFAIDAQLTEGLKELARRSGGTLYMVLLAAFKTLLHRYSGQSDICVGSPIANRQYGETEGLIGMFANTLALRSRVEAEEPFSAFLAQVKATCLEAYEHQDAPFEKVVDVVRPQRSLAVSPIFQVMVILQNADIGTLDERFPRLLLDSVVSKFDLTASFTERPEGLSGLIEYSTALYEPRTIARLIEHFIALCRAIVAAPAARICDLEYLGETETRRLLVDYNATRADYPADACLHQLFIDQVPLQPEKLAVICGDRHLTYRQLYERSSELARCLQALGAGPDRLVGVCMERSLDMIVGMLGILQAGGAYVPLDPDYPDDRLSYMVQDSQAAIVLTQESLRGQLRALVPAGTQLIALDAQWPEISAPALRQDVRPHHLSHVIYTSGSTGQPKGVAIEHHSPVTLVHWASSVYSREELAGVLASTSICFDLSVYEIFVTLANGGTIILVPNALGLIDLPNREAVTLINTVPSAMEELVRQGAIPRSVRTINLAGEPLSPVLVEKIYATTSTKKVYDLYGPSEDTTYSTWVLREPGAAATIGRPIANTEVYILDAHQRLQPIGVPGELHIAGDGLARGYLNRPELTRDKFVANPFLPGTRMYKTGDLARWLENGNIQYLGRIDTQVKVRGFRIELGEIEARLQQHDGIQDTAVVAQDHEGNKQLIAFYRAKATTAEQVVQLPSEELRAHLVRTLPEHMMPAAFVSLKAIPLNPNGKVDRRALARMDVTIASGREYVAPRNDAEKQLVEIWADVLKLAPETIGVNDNFFELGGHSLLATQLIAKVRGRLNVELPLKTVFERSTVARFAELMPEESRHSLLATQLMAKIRGRLAGNSPLKALLEQASVAELAELIAEAEESGAPAIRPVD